MKERRLAEELFSQDIFKFMGVLLYFTLKIMLGFVLKFIVS